MEIVGSNPIGVASIPIDPIYVGKLCNAPRCIRAVGACTAPIRKQDAVQMVNLVLVDCGITSACDYLKRMAHAAECGDPYTARALDNPETPSGTLMHPSRLSRVPLRSTISGLAKAIVPNAVSTAITLRGMPI